MLYARYIIVHPFHLFDIAMATYNKYTCSYTLFVASSRRHFHTNQWHSLLFSILKLIRWTAVQPFQSDTQHYRYICRIDKIWQATDLFQERRDTQSARGKENTRQASLSPNKRCGSIQLPCYKTDWPRKEKSSGFRNSTSLCTVQWAYAHTKIMQSSVMPLEHYPLNVHLLLRSAHTQLQL